MFNIGDECYFIHNKVKMIGKIIAKKDLEYKIKVKGKSFFVKVLKNQILFKKRRKKLNKIK